MLCHHAQVEASFPVEPSGWLLHEDTNSNLTSCKNTKKLRISACHAIHLTTIQPREEENAEGGLRRRKEKPEHAISELSIGSIIVLALLGLSLIACGILCTLKRCGPPTQVERQLLRFPLHNTSMTTNTLERNGNSG